jgi:hypothetical protein
VDQLRGDLPGRYLKNMGEGGFRYLMDHGIWYADAHHAHANTETIVGHTTLATGADPAAHGMIGNLWLDRQTGCAGRIRGRQSDRATGFPPDPDRGRCTHAGGRCWGQAAVRLAQRAVARSTASQSRKELK